VSSELRVRFAPSPTGFLHVGGARTALFNWLFARKHGGVFILRIEDTDLERSSPEVVQAIVEGMMWLDLQPDEGPFFQSMAVEEHRGAALQLIESGQAFRCFCTKETLDARRQLAESQARAWRYDRACLSLTAGERERFVQEGQRFAVRFLVPEGTTSFNDFVHGVTEFDNKEIEDFILLRSDGSPTYHLSVVSDDIRMRITHIIRGDDHLSNTPKQILLHRALGVEPPTFAHLPMILGSDKKRLSKRHGAVSVLEYREMGILPEAMSNFLALLGWSPGDDRQIMDREEIARAFSFEGVNKGGSVFDLQKLLWLNGQYISRMTSAELLPRVRDVLRQEGLWREEFEGEQRAWILALVDLLRPRSRTLRDFASDGRPFLAEDFPVEEDAVRKHLSDEEAASRLEALASALEGVPDWQPPRLEEVLRRLADSLGVNAGKLIHPARVALTGRAVSPGIFEVMATLGRDRTLARLRRGAARAAVASPR
jgi:glutamyl-tRNA synthetase